MLVNAVRERVFSAFSDLEFEPTRHIYTLKSTGRILPSVSRFVEGHAPKFNPDKVLRNGKTLIQSSADKVGVSVDELSKSWRLTNKEACDLGHNTHDFMENYTGHQTPRTPQEEAGVKFFKDMSKEYDVLFREIRMYSKKYHYAGTDDLVLIHKETGHLITADYKTNKDLFKSYDNLYPPFEEMEASPYNKYQIQLSYYQIMLEEVGIYVEDRWLVYLKNDGNYAIYHLHDFTEYLRPQLENRIAA